MRFLADACLFKDGFEEIGSQDLLGAAYSALNTRFWQIAKVLLNQQHTG